MTNSSYVRRLAAGTVVMSALALAACSSDDSNDEVSSVSQSVSVVGTEDPTSQLVTELYADALERGGYRVARRAAVADLAAGYAALNNGVADLFVSYTGELVEFLATEEPELAASTSTTEAPTTTTSTTIADSTTTTADSTDETTSETGDDSTTTSFVDESSTTTTISIVGQAASLSINLQYQQIGELLPDTLYAGAASLAEDKPVIACANSVATTGSLSTLSDVARGADVLRLAATAGWSTEEPFGAAGFKAVYDGEFTTIDTVEAGAIGAAITPETPPTDESSTTVADASTTSTTAPVIETDADCGAFASSLDSTIPQDAVVMDDDKDWIRTNAVLPLLTAAKYTLAGPVVDQVSQILTTADLRSMLGAVANGAAIPTVVDTYLTRNSIGS